MADRASHDTSDKLIGLYTQYRSALDALPSGGTMMPYRWWTRPVQLSGLWLPWDQMLEEFARELANAINSLTQHVDRLRAWHSVVEPLSDLDKLSVTHEFVDMVGIVALGLPYALKGKFAIAAAKLCHQANMAKDIHRADDFPVGNLYPHQIEPFCKGWATYRPFMRALEPLGGKGFREASANFRHAWNHDFSPRFVIGVSGSVTREVEADGRVWYGIGEAEPLTLSAVADLLAVERDHCYRVFAAFQALVEEQLSAIIAFDVAHAL